jgi:hypothetical protein
VSPSSFGTSRKIQACGFLQSSFVTVPETAIELSASNTAAKEWCPAEGAAIKSENIVVIILIVFAVIIATCLS